MTDRPRSSDIRTRGAALIEMLVACTLLSLLLFTATAVHAGARRASQLSQELAHRSQVIELSTELLRYHVGLAGHRGVSAPADLEGPALAVLRPSSSGASDALSVRYSEERWYSPPSIRSLRFDVKRDTKGLWNLYQREEGARRQPAVQRVSGLRIESFSKADGGIVPADSTLPLDATAVTLQIEFDWGESRLLTVRLPGVQQVVEESP